MDKQLDQDLRAFVSEPRTLHITGSADSIVGVAKAVIAAFFTDYPAHETAALMAQDHMLHKMASELGFDHPARWLGRAVCQSNGDQVFEMKP